jgi:signal transduction histidine kinase
MLTRDVLGSRALRFAVLFALAVAAITIAAFALVYLEVAREETNRLGAILTEEARLNVDASEDRLRAALAARQLSEIRRIDYLALFDAKGVVTLGNISRLPPIAVDGLPHVLDSGTMRKLAGASISAIVVARRRADGDILLLGRDLQDAYEVEETLLRALALALAPTIALFLTTGALFAKQAARRLIGVHEAITRIMGGDLSSRLPISREDDDIDHIAVAINLMLNELARLLDQLKIVGDNIAHELRAPLAVARAKLERALEQDCGGERVRVQAALEQIDRAAQIVAALLRIADVENGLRESRFRDVDLALVCEQTLEFYEPLAEAKSVAVTSAVNEPVVIRGDEDLLREAVANLVDNAIKFTPAGGAVSLAVGTVRGQPRLEIRDTGPGVAPADRDRIFQRFYRARVTEGEAGHGLGLSIAQAIAGLHGLELQVEDSPSGALFVMKLSRKA